MKSEESERWRRVEAILDQAWELPEEKRGPYLDEACAGDTELRVEVEAQPAVGARRDDQAAGWELSVRICQPYSPRTSSKVLRTVSR